MISQTFRESNTTGYVERYSHHDTFDSTVGTTTETPENESE